MDDNSKLYYMIVLTQINIPLQVSQNMDFSCSFLCFKSNMSNRFSNTQFNHNIWHFILQDLNYWASFLKDKNCPKSNYKLFGPTPKRWKVCHYVSSMKPISIKDHLGSSMNEFCPRVTSEFGLHRGFNWQRWRCINQLKYVITIKYDCNNS